MPTFLFTDIEGSTQMWEQHPQAMAQAMRRHDSILYEVIEEEGGRVVEHTGDGVYAVFEGEGNPLRAALLVQERFQAGDWGVLKEIKVRIGLNAAEPEQEGVDYFLEDTVYRGLAVNEAARVTAIGWGGQILLTPDVLRNYTVPGDASIVDLGAHMLKSLTQPRQIYGLLHPSLLTQEFPPLRSLSVRPNNLPPQSSPFVGREEELREILGYLESPDDRLVTLAGPGGVGKTRLAIQAAAEAIELFPHGVFFVPLASISGPEFIVPTIARAVDFAFYSGQNQKLQLLNYLREKKLLLIADNLEHLLEGTDILVEILNVATGVKIISTCRDWLNFAGERRLPVQGMEVPQETAQFSLSELPSYSAVQLFLQVARRSRTDFTMSRQNQAAIVQICRMVAGMPLGIELAATWTSVFTCSEIAEQIGNNLSFLTTDRPDVPERHRSLYAVCDYFWSQMSPEEQSVLRKLSQFRSGFRGDAAWNVAGASFFFLSALMDRAFLRRQIVDRDEPYTRYEIHEVLRHFAKEKLAQHPEEESRTRERHAHYFADFLYVRETALKDRRQVEALAEIHEEIDNVRKAWEWAMFNRRSDALEQSFVSLYLAYDLLGWYEEGAELLGQAAAALKSSTRGQDQGMIARLQARRAYFLQRLSQHEEGKRLLKQSLAVARRLDQQREIAFCLHYLGVEARVKGRFEEGRRLMRKSVDIYRQLDMAWELSMVLSHLADAVYRQGRYEEARETMWKSYVIRQKLNEPRSLASTLVYLGVFLKALGQPEEARVLLQEGLNKHRSISNNDWHVATSTLNLGVLAHDSGDYEEAQRHYRRSLSIYRDLGNQWTIAAALDNLGQTALQLEQRSEAAGHFIEALQVALGGRVIHIALDVLVGAASMMADDERDEDALRILSFVLQHPRIDRAETEERARNMQARLLAQGDPSADKDTSSGTDPLQLEEAVALALDYLTTVAAAGGNHQPQPLADGDRQPE